MKILRTTFIMLTIVNAQHTLAQDRSFTTDPIKVVKAYEPILADPQKITTRPNLPEVTAEKPNLTYNQINVPKLRVDKDLKPIQAIKAQKESPSPINGNYLKAGYGNFNSPLVNVHLMSVRNPTTEYGIDLQHFSSNGNINYENERFEQALSSNNKISAYGKTNALNHNINARIDYDRLGARYFGYDRNRFDFSSDSIQQVYNKIGSTIGLASNQDNVQKWKYKTDLSFYNLSDKFSQGETNFRLDAGLAKSFSDNSLTASFVYDFTSYKHNGNAFNRSLILFNPVYNIQFDEIRIKVGINTASQILSDSSSFHLYPDIGVIAPILGEKLLFEGSISGNLQRVGWNTLVERNPFVGHNLDIRNVNNALVINTAISGKLDDASTYKAYIQYNNIKNGIFFLNDPENHTRLIPIYENRVNRVDIGANYQFDLFKQLNINIGAEARIFNLDSLEKPWNEPTLFGNLGARYLLTDKLRINANVQAFNAVSVLVLTPNPEISGRGQLNGVVDVSLGADYTINKQLSIWLQANNLASMRYFRYFNYPTYGLNFLGGLTFSL